MGASSYIVLERHGEWPHSYIKLAKYRTPRTVSLFASRAKANEIQIGHRTVHYSEFESLHIDGEEPSPTECIFEVETSLLKSVVAVDEYISTMERLLLLRVNAEVAVEYVTSDQFQLALIYLAAELPLLDPGPYGAAGIAEFRSHVTPYLTCDLSRLSIHCGEALVENPTLATKYAVSAFDGDFTWYPIVRDTQLVRHIVNAINTNDFNKLLLAIELLGFDHSSLSEMDSSILADPVECFCDWLDWSFANQITDSLGYSIAKRFGFLPRATTPYEHLQGLRTETAESRRQIASPSG